MKVGLFFGSFNPIHIGHLIIANTMVEVTDMDQVWFVVSPQNPLKSSKTLLNEIDRLNMVELAIEDNFKLRASNIEFSMPKPSYTIDTLTYLSEKYPKHEFALIVGQDNLLSFTRWKNHQAILQHYSLYVYPRPGSKPTDLQQHPKVNMVNAPMIDISATFIRDCVRNYRSIRYLVPPNVEQHILERKFFQ